jgi:hypothetical protein
MNAPPAASANLASLVFGVRVEWRSADRCPFALRVASTRCTSDGYTVKAMERKIERGDWLEDKFGGALRTVES